MNLSLLHRLPKACIAWYVASSPFKYDHAGSTLQVRCMAAVLMMVGQQLEHPDVVQQLLDIQQTPCKPQYRYASEVSADFQWSIQQEALFNMTCIVIDIAVKDRFFYAGASLVLEMRLQEHQDADF